MKTKYLATIAMALSTAAMIPTPSVAGNAEGNGGHGVQQPNGEVIFLDLSDEATISDMSMIEYLATLRIIAIGNPLLNSETKEAAEMVMTKLDNFTSVYPDFVKSVKLAFQSLNWQLSQDAIRKQLPDYAITLVREGGEIVQLGVQTEGGMVVIDQEVFQDLKNDEERAAFLLHETMLYKLGPSIPRAQLRNAIRAIMAGSIRDLESEIGKISQQILADRLEFTIYVGPYAAHYTGAWLICNGHKYPVIGAMGSGISGKLLVPTNPKERSWFLGKSKDVQRCQNDPQATVKIHAFGMGTANPDFFVRLNGVVRSSGKLEIREGYAELTVPTPIF